MLMSIFFVYIYKIVLYEAVFLVAVLSPFLRSYE